MKLLTSIPPRADGTVIVHAKDGKDCTFAAGPDGELVGEVEHEETLRELLRSERFFPADPADYDRAMEITGPLSSSADEEEEEADPDAPGAEDEVVNGGLPVESNTAPKPANAGKGGKGGKAAAKAEEGQGGN